MKSGKVGERKCVSDEARRENGGGEVEKKDAASSRRAPGGKYRARALVASVARRSKEQKQCERGNKRERDELQVRYVETMPCSKKIRVEKELETNDEASFAGTKPSATEKDEGVHATGQAVGLVGLSGLTLRWHREDVAAECVA